MTRKPTLHVDTSNAARKNFFMKHSLFRHTTSGSIDFIQKSWKVGATGLKERTPRPPSDTSCSSATTPSGTGDQEKIYPFQSTTIQPSDIKILKELGTGGSSTVHLIAYRDSQFALKVINLDDEKHQFKSAQSEIESLRRLQGVDYVVGMRQAYIRNRRIAIILDYCNCSSLDVAYRKCNRLTQRCSLARGARQQARGVQDMKVLASLASHTLLAMWNMERNRICHRDIKPSNLLLHSLPGGKGLVRLTDFGLAKIISANELCTEIVGTTKYHSPERIAYQSYDTAADVWSFGIAIAEIFLGRYPFQQQLDECNEEQFRKFILNDPLKHESFPSSIFPSDLLQFISACLERDPSKRATAEQLLQFPFLKHAQNEEFSQSVLGKWIENTALTLPKVSNPVSISSTSTPRGRRASMVHEFFSVSCESSPVVPMSIGSSLGLNNRGESLQLLEGHSLFDSAHTYGSHSNNFMDECDPCADEFHCYNNYSALSPRSESSPGLLCDNGSSGSLADIEIPNADCSYLPGEIEMFGFSFDQ